MVTEREPLQTALNGMNSQDELNAGISMTNQTSENSDKNVVDFDDPDSEQWMQVGRSHSGRRSQKKKMKNSNSYESFHNYGPRNSYNRGPSSVSSVPSNSHRENGFVNGHVPDHPRAVATASGLQSSGSNKLPSVSSSVSSGVHSASEFDHDRPYRFQGRPRRGRSSFQCMNSNADNAPRVPFPANTSIRPAFRKPHYSSSFSHNTTRHNPNMGMYRSMNNPRYRPPVSIDSHNDTPIVATTCAIPSSTAPHSITSTAPSTVGERTTNPGKVTWAATVAAAAKPVERPPPSANGPHSANQTHQMIAIFLKNQWRLFCEEHRQN